MSRCCRRLTQYACQGRRTYAQAAVQLSRPSSSSTPSASIHRRPVVPLFVQLESPTPDTTPSTAAVTRRQRPTDLTPQAEYLRDLFPGLSFSNELSRRILTHASHPAAAQGHSGQLSFMGRRVLESYFMVMLSSSRALNPSDDLEEIASRALNTYLIGEHVGRKWDIGRVLRWVPATTVYSDKVVPGQGRSIGLYKVQGDTVSAVLGGVFREWGATTAQRVFSTRIMPHLLHGLSSRFHPDVVAACNHNGGLEGTLLHGQKTPKVPEDTGLVVTLSK